MGEFKLNSFGSDDELVRAVAGAWLDEIELANRAGALHTVALAGGRIVKKFYPAVVQLAQARGVSFQNVHFFWGDERCVPPEDADSNYRIAADLLFPALEIPADHIHRIHGETPSSAAADAATEISQKVLLNAAGQPVLDLIFLGMGEDGHVASLFPGEPEAVVSSSAVYRTVTASKPPPQRVTLGYRTITAARQVWLLASGAGKEGALRESLKLGGKTPLARVLALRGKTVVFSDISL